jgi:hypothetical protein
LLEIIVRFKYWERLITSFGKSKLSATIHPNLKRTFVAMSELTGLSIYQVTDEVLYTGLVELQELMSM